MLFRAEHYKRVPTDLAENLRFRRRIIERCSADPNAQRVVREMCRQDIIFYINTFVWQYNPKERGVFAKAPFICYPFQVDMMLRGPESPDGPGILWCWENRLDCFVEKSREMGATWFFLMFEDAIARFVEYSKLLNVSRSAEAVDKKDDSDSLFWKLRFINDNLPEWLRGRMGDKTMLLTYKDSHSSIAGSATTEKAGVGGRAGAIFFDEFSQVAMAREMYERTSDTSDVRFFNGTHLGTDTFFYELSQSPFIKKLKVHWTLHPKKNRGLYRYELARDLVHKLDDYDWPEDYDFVKDGTPTGGPFPGIRSPWYDQQCVRKGSMRAVAQDLDICPEGAASQYFDMVKLEMLRIAYCEPPKWRGELAYDVATGQPLRFVPSSDGRLKLWCDLTPERTMPIGSYGAGADISNGIGSTPTTLSIGDAQIGRKVLEYANAEIYPHVAAMLFAAICRMCRDEEGQPALLVWEHVGPGLIFGKHVIEAGYTRIRRRPRDETETIFTPGTTDAPGWIPTASRKRILFEEYAQALYARMLINPSEEAIKDCGKVKFDKMGELVHSGEVDAKDESGARVNHADIVIADALMWMMLNQLGRREYVAPPKQTVPLLSMAWRREYLRQLQRERDY